MQKADLIFTGRMKSQRCEWQEIQGQRSIVTIVTFDVLGVHKGAAGRTVDLQFLGGTIGDTTLEVTAMPRFKKGERAVLFVAENGVNASPLVGFFHGKFRVESDESGQDVVSHADGTPLTDVAEIGKSRRTFGRRAMSLSDFTQKVAESARKGK